MTPWEQALEDASKAIMVKGGYDPDDRSPDAGGTQWAKDYLKAAIASLRASGYVVMPEKMSDEMSNAIDRVDVAVDWNWKPEYIKKIRRQAKYKNMIATAQKEMGNT